MNSPPAHEATAAEARALGALLAQRAAEWAATLVPDASDGRASSDAITIKQSMVTTGQRDDIVEAGGAVWLRTQHGVVRVDTRTGDAVSVPTDDVVSSMVAADDALWASIWDTGGHVVRVDATTGTVTDTFELGLSAESGSDLIIADGGLWAASYPTSSSSAGAGCCPDAGYARIDLTTKAVTSFSSDVDLGVWIGERNGALWAYNAFTTHLQDGTVLGSALGNALTRVDLSSGQAQRYDLDSKIGSESGAVLAGDDIWVVDIYGAAARFDVESGRLTDRLSLGSGTLGGSVGGVGASGYANGGVWITKGLNGTVVRIDAATAEVTDTITLEPTLGRSLLVGDSLWVTKTTSEDLPRSPAHSDGVVYRIDLVSRSLVETVETGLDGQLFPFLRNGEMWVAASDGETVRLTAVG